jgi:hypothetical protein
MSDKETVMNSMRHKVFISYHHANDQAYRDKFERLFYNQHNIMISKSVQIGDIDPNAGTDYIRNKIRTDYLQDSTVTVVLIGTHTWQRKHVDWEIGSSIRDTKNNTRSGLFGIFLPTYPLNDNTYNPYTIPPRLQKNVESKYAKLYVWDETPSVVLEWIHQAFERRNTCNPDNSYPSFVNNKSGQGWS